MEKENAKVDVKFINENEWALVHTIGNTDYLIRSVFSDKSKERFEDKLIKIILKDVRPESNRMSNLIDE